MPIIGVGTASPPARHTKAECLVAFERSAWFARLGRNAADLFVVKADFTSSSLPEGTISVLALSRPMTPSSGSATPPARPTGSLAKA